MEKQEAFSGCKSFLKKSAVFAVCSLVVMGIGYSHIMVGREIALSGFFLVPIVIASWYSGTIPGLLIAALSTGVWLYGDILMISSFSAYWLPFLNETLRFIVFIFVVSILHIMKKVIRINRNLAVLDSLTNLYNRRGFNIEGYKEIERSRRTGNSFSVIYMDIDNFKDINDTLGHHTGDEVLVCVAGIMKSRLRNMDIVARLGGDEFIMMLPRTSGKFAEKAVAKLQKLLDESMVRNNWQVSFSFGIASFSDGIPASVNIAISAADRIMYIAKNSGKNRIEIREVNAEGCF